MYYLRPKLQQLIHWIWLPVWGVGGQVTPKWWEPAERNPVDARREGRMLEETGGVWGPGGEPEQRGCSQTVCCLWECFYFSSGALWPQRVSTPPSYLLWGNTCWWVALTCLVTSKLRYEWHPTYYRVGIRSFVLCGQRFVIRTFISAGCMIVWMERWSPE